MKEAAEGKSVHDIADGMRAPFMDVSYYLVANAAREVSSENTVADVARKYHLTEDELARKVEFFSHWDAQQKKNNVSDDVAELKATVKRLEERTLFLESRILPQ